MEIGPVETELEEAGAPMPAELEQATVLADGLQPGEPAEQAALTAKPSLLLMDPDRLHRFVVGFLVAAAFFFIEAGVSEVLLARNANCLDGLARMRLAPNPEEVCMSEFGQQFAASLSRATFDPETPPVLVWLLLAVGYGLLGGAFAQLNLRWAVGGYLIVHLLLVIGFTSISYLSRFIV